MMAERLSPEDSRILALESRPIVGHTCKVVIAERIREVCSLAEIAPHHALRVSAISFAGRIAIGLCADGDAIPELSELAEGVERSLVEPTESVTA